MTQRKIRGPNRDSPSWLHHESFASALISPESAPNAESSSGMMETFLVTNAKNADEAKGRRASAATNDGSGSADADTNFVRQGGGGKELFVSSEKNNLKDRTGKQGKPKRIIHSASSIVLELLEQTAKQRLSESRIMAPPNTPSTATPAANNDNSEIIMSINHPAAATASVEAAGINNHLDGNQASSSSSNNNPQQNPKSVVPQLMDIYDDLTQSSTPQTTTVPGLPLPKGVYYSGNHQSFDTSSSQTSNERSGSRRRSGSKSQYTNGGGVASSTVPATTTSSTTSRSQPQRKSTNKKVKASEMMMDEEYLPNKQGGGSRKKGKTSSADPRWSKRFTWPDEVGTAI